MKEEYKKIFLRNKSRPSTEYLNTLFNSSKNKKEKMEKKCIYCKNGIDENSVLDVCTRCGIGVWGEKMFNAIKQSMENARESGDLFQGSISNPQPMKPSLRKAGTFVPTDNKPTSFSDNPASS